MLECYIKSYTIPFIESGEREHVLFYPCKCVESMEARRKQRWDEDQAPVEEQARQWEKLLATSGLTGWLERATMEKFLDRPDWDQAKVIRDRVEAYTDSLQSASLDTYVRPWLILHGSYGTGKTHLAAAIIHDMLRTGLRKCYFLVWPDFLAEIQMTWDDATPHGRQEMLMRKAREGNLLVLDDIDKRRATPWTRESLFMVLNFRYNRRLPTILTFNFGPEDADPDAAGRLALVEYLGAATMDRMIELAWDVIDFNGPSFRSQISWSKQNG